MIERTMHFEWHPGNGPDADALSRLLFTFFARPPEAMGEAWFMSDERRMFHELVDEDAARLPTATLERALEEIASGTSAFGPMEEWLHWYHYLLPRLVPRSHETTVHQLLELLVTALCTQYPTGLETTPYPEFGSDVLLTVGRCQMDAVRWPGGHIDLSKCLDKRPNRFGAWDWQSVGGPLSASLALCLKYLDVTQIDAWLKSVLAIDEPHWRAQILCWLSAAHPVLTGRLTQPDEFPDQITWSWSHCLHGDYTGNYADRQPLIDFVPVVNRDEALSSVRRHVRKDIVLTWIESFAEDPMLDAGIGDLPFEFMDRYALE